ncbi:hypothetical protein ACYSNX_04190 [Myroides sp. LJL115]
MIHTEKTLSQVINILKKRGYTADFNLLEVQERDQNNHDLGEIEDLVIDKIYRFAPQNDADDESILYAITNRKNSVKGVFVNGYGISSSDKASAIVDQITVEIIDQKDDWTK